MYQSATVENAQSLLSALEAHRVWRVAQPTVPYQGPLGMTPEHMIPPDHPIERDMPECREALND